MFRITEDPLSGRLVQYLAKNYKNDSIVSVDMDKVGVMAAYCDPLCVCVVRFKYFIILILSTFTTMILGQRPLSTIYDNLSLTNSTLFIADIILRCKRKPVPN